MKKIFWMTLVLASISGCGAPAQRIAPHYMPAAPPNPPAPPPRRNVSLDPSLRDAARQVIITTSLDNDPILRANAIEAMQYTFGDEAGDSIVNGLNDPEPVVRFAAGMAAGKLKLQPAYSRLQAMADEPDMNCRVASRYALHCLGDKQRSHDFETYARFPDHSVRANVALALGMLGEPTALRILRPMTSDSDANVRLQAAEAMWRLGDQDGLDNLVVGTVSQYPDDQIIALIALAEPRDGRVAGHLKSRLTSEAPEVSLAAARALGMIGSDAGYAVAAKGIKSGDVRQQAMAALALGQIGRSDAQPLLAPLLKESDPNIRLAAATAILQLKAGS